MWLGTGIGGGGGGGGTVSDVVWVGANAPADPEMELWWDTDEELPAGGAGGGTEEVYIGPSEPSAGYELWYNTAAPAPLTYDLRWHTAWGVVAVGTLNVMSGYAFTSTTLANLSSPMTVTLLAGRRYEFEARIHATSGSSANGVNLQFAGLGGNDTWNYASNLGWSHASHQMPVVGTGAAVTVTLQGMLLNAGTVNFWTTQPSSYFVCRDVGPAAGAGSVVPPPADWSVWTPLTLGSTWTQKAGWETASYCKVLNHVKVRGVVSFGAGGANPMATLPSGYRPALAVRQATQWTRTSDSASLPLIIEVSTGGAISLSGLSAAGHHDINVEFFV